jgi:uncharacterized membrane protein YgaE (UPF0421/DUF939 family)
MTLHEHVERFRVRLAIKTAVAAVLCGFIVIAFHLQYGYLAPLFTILILIVFRGRTIEAGVPGFFACLVAGSIAMIINVVLNDAPWAYVLCMLTWLFVWMVWLTPVPIGHVLGGILIAMILFTVVLGTGPAEDLLLGFWSQAFIGLAVAVAVDHLLWPSEETENSLYDTLAALFEAFAADLEALATAPSATPAAEPTSMAELCHIAHLSNFFAGNLSGNTNATFELNLRCRLVWDRLAGLRRFMRSSEYQSLQNELANDLNAVLTDLAIHYRGLANAALLRQPTAYLGDDRHLSIQKRIETVHAVPYREPNATDRRLAAATIGRFLRHALIDHAQLARAYNAMIDGRVTPKRGWAPSCALSDLLAWPTAVAFKTSAKLVLIMLVLLVGVLYLDFPGSSLVAFYGVTFGLTANLGQLYMKGKTGVLGIAGGLAYGIVGVSIIIQTPHLLVLMGIFALGVFLSAYLAAGDETVAFMGLQAALVAPYVFFIFEGPEWTLTNGITRTCALAIAAVVAVVIQRVLWPVDPLALLRTVAVEALSDIGGAWRQLWASDHGAGPYAGAAFQARSDGLILTFDKSAELLKDSRYAVGSNHPLAGAYMQLLRSLEEIFAEVQLLARLIQQNKDNPLLDDAVAGYGEEIDTIAHGLATASDYVRDQTSAAPMIDVQTRLAAFDDDTDRPAAFGERDSAATLEDRRQMLRLVGTLREIARSLGSVVDAALAFSPVSGRHPDAATAHQKLAPT